MEKRIHRRFARRVEVRFWRRGEQQGHLGFTTNLSKSGLFLGSASSLATGERLRLEVIDRDAGFMAEGRVARVHRVSLALRQVDQPGAGVRFLTAEELIEELIPLAKQAGPARVESVPQGSAHPTATYGTSRADGDQSTDEAVPQPEEVPEGEELDGSQEAARTVAVCFDDPSRFVSVFHRDILSGGLFVSTDEPADLHQKVWIELTLPLEDEHPRLFEALVVQRFPTQGAVEPGRNHLGGMAVQFLEPEQVVAELRPLLARLRG